MWCVYVWRMLCYQNRNMNSYIYECGPVLLSILVMADIALAVTDPCETNHFIDNWKRSTMYEPNDGKFLCDSLIFEDWYRVISGSGELMPTECIHFGWRCGTVKPIYLSSEGFNSTDDIYPSDGEEVNRTAYAVDDIDCRAQEYTIKIKNCTEYLVYFLKRTINCNTAYCFGSVLPCADDEKSNTGFEPGCSKVFPNISLSPTITVDMVMETVINGQTSKKFYETPRFKCEAPDATAEYSYDIHYYINDVHISNAAYTNIPFDDIGNAVLLQSHWQKVFKPNMLVKCSMQARFPDRGAPGEKYYSEVFFAGIKALNVENGIVVKEDEETKIQIKVTLPIGCSYRSPSQKILCYVGLRNGVPKYQTDGDCATEDNMEFGPQACMLQIFNSNWSSIHSITVKGKSDSVVNKQDRLVYLRLFTGGSSVNNDLDVLRMWDSINLPDIKIYIRDNDIATLGKTCYSHNDPHMRTFDGTTWELQGSANRGEYILYKHDLLPQQVNAYFSPCYTWDALCNCGIAVRSGNSLFIANFCKTGPITMRRTNRYVASRLCDDQNLIVEEQGSDAYKIILPSGTTVQFTHGEIQLNDGTRTYLIHRIDIQASKLDFEYTSGLCGRYSNIKDTDDFVSRDTNFPTTDKYEFARTWRINNSAETFFDPTITLPPLTYKVQEYCTCYFPVATPQPGDTFEADFTCRRSDKVSTCSGKDLATTVYHASCLSSAHNIGKRATEDDGPPMYAMSSDDDETIDREPPEWRNGLNEQIARNKCESYLNALPAFAACMEYVPTVNAESYVEECVSDMKLAGSDSFLQVMLQNFESSCLKDAKRIENLTETNTTSPTGEEKSIFAVISESTCPRNCSGKGSCKEGVCSCIEGAFGKDCAFNKNIPPHLLDGAFEKSCDSSSKKCQKFPIPGSDFIAANLTCRFRRFKVMQNNSVINEYESFTHPGTYSSTFLMYCELPETRKKRSVESEVISTGYYISVSNDGKNFTEELTILIFDTRCYDCNSTSMTCTEVDSCPTKSEPPSTESSSRYLGISIGIGTAFAIVLIIVIVISVRKRCMKRKPYVSDSSVGLPNPNVWCAANTKPTLHSMDIFIREKTTL